VPLVFVLRHPCAVVASRLSLGWATDEDLDPLLAQPALAEDFLLEHMPLIAGARRPEEKHAVIWCVTNLVPLSQFPSDELALFFYEDLCLQPGREIPRLFRALGHPLGEAGIPTDRPSMVTRRGPRGSRSRIDGWRSELTAAQIDAVLGVVRRFKLDDLYGEGSTPLPGAQRRWSTEQ
jgi:hypothetical protein